MSTPRERLERERRREGCSAVTMTEEFLLEGLPGYAIASYCGTSDVRIVDVEWDATARTLTVWVQTFSRKAIGFRGDQS